MQNVKLHDDTVESAVIELQANFLEEMSNMLLAELIYLPSLPYAL